MKELTARSVVAGAVLCAALSSFAGCASAPKDTYIREGEIVINTPWGPSSLKGGVIATGKAAIAAAVEAVKAENAAAPK
jgi:hypothetical protein